MINLNKNNSEKVINLIETYAESPTEDNLECAIRALSIKKGTRNSRKYKSIQVSDRNFIALIGKIKLRSDIDNKEDLIERVDNAFSLLFSNFTNKYNSDMESFSHLINQYWLHLYNNLLSLVDNNLDTSYILPEQSSVELDLFDENRNHLSNFMKYIYRTAVYIENISKLKGVELTGNYPKILDRVNDNITSIPHKGFKKLASQQNSLEEYIIFLHLVYIYLHAINNKLHFGQHDYKFLARVRDTINTYDENETLISSDLKNFYNLLYFTMMKDYTFQEVNFDPDLNDYFIHGESLKKIVENYFNRAISGPFSLTRTYMMDRKINQYFMQSTNIRRIVLEAYHQDPLKNAFRGIGKATYKSTIESSKAFEHKFTKEVKNTYEANWDFIKNTLKNSEALDYYKHQIMPKYSRAIKTSKSYASDRFNFYLDSLIDTQAEDSLSFLTRSAFEIADLLNFQQFKPSKISKSLNKKLASIYDDSKTIDTNESQVELTEEESEDPSIIENEQPTILTNIYEIGNIKLHSPLNQLYSERIIRWFDPNFKATDLYGDHLNGHQAHHAQITHNFAWAVNNLLVAYGIKGIYSAPNGQKQDQLTLPIKIEYHDYDQEPFYGKVVMTKDNNDVIYHRHITKANQSNDIERDLFESGLERELNFPALRSQARAKQPLVNSIDDDNLGEYGDASYINLEKCTSSSIAVEDPKNGITIYLAIQV